jgi:hypothetical protein
MNGLCSIAMLNYQMVIPCNFPSIPLLFVRSHQNHHKISSISHEFPCCLGYPSNHPPTGPQAAGSLRVAGRGLAPRRQASEAAACGDNGAHGEAAHGGARCALWPWLHVVYIYMYIYICIYICIHIYICTLIELY